MYGLYLTLKPYRVLALETSVTQNTTAKEGGVFDREKLRSCTYKFSSQNIRNHPSKSLTYKAPYTILPSPASVSQDTTIQAYSKGKHTFPFKIHYSNPVFH